MMQGGAIEVLPVRFGLGYGETIRDLGHREHVKCGQAADRQ
jgi:hypothetical protein